MRLSRGKGGCSKDSAADGSGRRRVLPAYLKYGLFHGLTAAFSLYLAWSVYREWVRGAEGVPPAQGVESAVKAAFPSSVLLFVAGWLAITLWRNRGPHYLSLLQYAALISLYAILVSLFFRNAALEVLTVQGLAILSIAAALALWFAVLRFRVIALENTFTAGQRNAVLAVILALFGLTLISQNVDISPGQWALVFIVTALSFQAYRILGRETLSAPLAAALALLLYAAVAAAAFSPTMGDIFRGDYWYIATLFNSQEALSLSAVEKIAFFEMFGDVRFQPLAHLAMFARHMLLGSHVVLYNVLNVLLHATVSLLVFLVLFEATGERRVSFLLGLIFVTLSSQFDTVAWTYHVYIIAGTAAGLLAVLLALRYSRTKKPYAPLSAITLSLVSIFFYEPAILAPAAVSFLIASALPEGNRGRIRVLVLAGVAAALAYIVYLGFAGYGTDATPAGRMTVRDLANVGNVTEALKAVIVNLWESGFLKNAGVLPEVQAKEIVYVPLQRRVLTDFSSLPVITAGAFVVSLFVATKKNFRIFLVAAALALSYFFLISLGRVFTNEISYIVSQPRYEYFPNAFLMVAAGALLVPAYRDRRLGAAVTAALFLVFFWNTRNVLHAANIVSSAISPMNAHYLKIKDFLAEKPSAKLFVDFVPDTQGKFPMGTDIAFDTLFRGRTTKILHRADYIYDGNSFKENSAYGAAAAGPYAGDFTVSWMYRESRKTPPLREAVVTGSEKIFPRISVYPSGYIEVALKRTGTGEVDLYMLRYQYAPGDWASMAVERDGGFLCLIYQGRLQDRMRLASDYDEWEADGAKILGSYFSGSREPVYVAKLFIQSGAAKYGCGLYHVGDELDVDIKKPW